MEYIFEPAKKCEIPDIFRLYAERVKWMDMKALRQWNTTDYLSRYPIEYYFEQCEAGRLFVMRAAMSDEIVGAVVLLYSDSRWRGHDDVPAYYVHNLVTAPDAVGAGRYMLNEVEKMAIAHGKHFVRLDCAIDNPVLNDYYGSLGYEISRQCEDGPYIGNLRQKSL